MLRGLVTAGLLLWALPAFAAPPDGDWSGVLHAGARGDLHMLFRFRHEDGALKAQFVSLDQAGASFPAAVTLDGAHLVMTLPFGATYDGTIAADGKAITGTFTQHVPLPLTLTPGSGDAPTAHTPQAGDLVVQTPTGALAGTMIRKGGIGAVILTGSGDANRDGNSAAFGARGTYRMLAEELAAHDISTLRYDKRGIGESAGAMAREDDITLPVMAGDAGAVASELRKRLGSPCAWLIGHSEGGVVALLAAQDNRDICGLVLLASPGRNVTEILHEQFDHLLPAADKPAAFAALDELQAGKMPTDAPPQLKNLFRPSLTQYWLTQVPLDPATLVRKLKIPVLILQGDSDVQISVRDAQALAKAKPDATLKIEAGVNHSQRVAKDDTDGGPVPLAPGLVDTIAAFMKAHQ